MAIESAVLCSTRAREARAPSATAVASALRAGVCLEPSALSEIVIPYRACHELHFCPAGFRSPLTPAR